MILESPSRLGRQWLKRSLDSEGAQQQVNQQKEDVAGFKGLTGEELRTVSDDLRRDRVESEISALAYKLRLGQAEEELAFRDSGKPKRAPDEWRQQWFDSVNGIAAAHHLDPAVVWELARKIEAQVRAQEAGQRRVCD